MATGGLERSIEKGCDEFYDYSCTPCLSEGRNEEAINFCIECDEYLCQKCLQHHNKFGKMRTHQILDKSGMKARGRGRQQAPPQASVPMEKCSTHHGNIIDTFCGIHDAVCCGTCASLSHRSCDGMEYLPTAAKGIKQSNEYKDIKSSIQDIRLQLDKMKKTRQDELETLEKDKDAVQTQIKDFRKRLIKRLDDLEKSSTDELQAKHQEFQDEINADIKSLEEILTAMETNLKKLETSTGDNESQLFVYVKTAKKTETEGRKLLQEIKSGPARGTLKFTINPNIEDYLKNQQSLGDLCEDEKVYSASLHGEFNMEVEDDDHMCDLVCDISGSCELEDGTLLVVDFNNDKLKRLNKSYQVRDYCDLPGGPYAVCATGPQEVAVTLFGENRVQFVDVSDNMVLARSFSVDDICYGIAYTNDQLYVSTTKDLHVFNKAGTLLRTIQNDSAGQPIVSDPRHIAVSTDGTKIHIADGVNGVITLDLNTNNHSQFTDPDLEGACGVYVRRKDEIFVCGFHSNNVVQMSSSGIKLGTVLQGEVSQPQSLLFDRANSRLMVTMEHTDLLKVFDIK